MQIKIALAGNPNSGKTTMFNDLTGSTQRVGNWPGVTVEKKEGTLKGRKEVVIQDLPGIYSLSPYTLEEVVSRTYLTQDKPDAIINIVDGSNLERNLFLTTQLSELGLPMVIALNMMDIVNKQGDKIDIDALSKAIGCPVIETSAVKSDGTKAVAEKAAELAAGGVRPQPPSPFSGTVEHAIAHIEDLVRHLVDERLLRWYAVKLFERDEKVLKELKLDGSLRDRLEEIITQCETEMEDDSESIITGERYIYIAQVIGKCLKKKNKSRLSTSDRIDKIVTNRFLALPIFALVMFLVYFVSITTVGTWMTDWVNDSLFGEIIPGALGGWLESIAAAGWLQSLIMDGIVAGVGAVLGFLPQMLTLFLCLAILEDCGYMARIAFIMDRIFRRFGLSGKSFIPILIGTGCSVPGIMASRTIENESDRRMTVITTSFMPCSAKLPIIALIAGALFADAWWVGASAYFVGIAAIILSGILLKKTRLFSGDPAPFVMELPAYHLPRFKGVVIQMWDRGKAFVRKAGTIIFVASCLVWFFSTFNWRMEMVETGESMLAGIGGFVAPIFSPLGWGDWRAAVATLTGLTAKEVVVSTFGILFGFGEVAENGVEIWANLQAAFTPIAAYSFLLFNLLCAPCFAAIGAIRREMMSGKWTLIAVGYQTVLAYAVALCFYQLAGLFTGGGFGFGTAVAFILLIGFLYLLFRTPKAPEKESTSAVKVGAGR